jgi:hypothetical protein
MSDTDDAQEYPLADLRRQLARQLEKANRRVVQAGRPVRLRWTRATVELGVTWEKTGDGEVDLKVVRLGGGITKANTTTITVTVVPSDPGPEGVAQPDDRDLAIQAPVIRLFATKRGERPRSLAVR